MSATIAAGQRLGRFVLRRPLGRGAQASVWLAHDPRLDREVALKLLDPEAGLEALHEWLHEARAVSRLTHPNIVPVFEADEVDGQPCLVFEYVEGRTLSEARKGRGRMPAREAAGIVLEVLAALAAAHAQGIVHRDLKPSNILLGRDGRARVMDFGIAARVETGGASAARRRIVGTPGYISPEAARGDPPTPVMDVFAAGVVLGELLAGGPLMVERDPYRYVRRVQVEDLLLPADLEIDDILRGIVQRALARDASQRYDSAASMHAALAAWLNPADAGSAADTLHGRSTIEFLLRRMRHKSDFPALSNSVVRIQQVASSETESLASLAAEILKDVALTNKLLRMVNTVQFRHAAGEGITTVSRAVALVGFAGIRNMALSLVLLEHMNDKQHAALLREEYLRALMAGTLAAELLPQPRVGEEAFLGSMLQNLGRLLTEYYFPDEARQVRQALAGAPNDPVARETASLRVLGVGFQDLGVGIARSWGLPDSLQRTMRAPDGTIPQRRLEGESDRLRWLGRAANEITDLVLLHDGEALDAALTALAERYATALDLSPRAIVAAVASARRRMAATVQALGLQIPAGAPSHRLIALAAPTAAIADPLAPLAMPSTLALADDGEDRRGGVPSAQVLAAGMQEVTAALVADGCRLNDVVRMVLETLYRALGASRVVICLRDARPEQLVGRFGFGDRVEEVARAFRVPLRPQGTPDLFAAVCLKGMDTLITDAAAPNVAGRLPPWFRDAVGAGSFLLLPLMHKGAAFGLVYVDARRAGGLVLGDAELSMLRTLRNQLVLAFRQLER